MEVPARESIELQDSVHEVNSMFDAETKCANTSTSEVKHRVILSTPFAIQTLSQSVAKDG